ncbi:monovalent cation/H+ antiporter complex subunit F [Flexivirga oryzae]|uniref:Multicomponent Na+:H+ antiporter subunit F n=1 Tax=Flexivirga oryzae TaxID=1794944 RepID=A0A839N179_9MICO|nr:monovalent cation/H+ antiporter complex subunit F [Flexivirga oryzae]MBB2891500.1 multicomponent Na+:H+ antiporter subunit F [Flexivirga oryzae]
MRTVALVVCITQVAIACSLLVRLGLGPTVSDRIVAINAISIQLAVAVLFYAVAADRVAYLDVAIWMVAFGYLTSFIWSRYLERGLL